MTCSHLRPRFDLVVSNPPFRRCKSGLLNVEEEKAIARHEIMLKLDELADAAAALLKIRGRFCLIHHPSRLAELIVCLEKEGNGTQEAAVCSFLSCNRG